MRSVVYILRERRAHKNTVILRTGQLSSDLFFIKEGKVKVYATDDTHPSGKMQ